MTQLPFLPQWPLLANPLALFGVLLFLGLIGGEFSKRALKLPRITGYVLVGVALGASGLKLLDDVLIAQSWIFVDIALGLILFELGRRLHLGWLRRDRWLPATGVAGKRAGVRLYVLARWSGSVCSRCMRRSPRPSVFPLRRPW